MPVKQLRSGLFRGGADGIHRVALRLVAQFGRIGWAIVIDLVMVSIAVAVRTQVVVQLRGGLTHIILGAVRDCCMTRGEESDRPLPAGAVRRFRSSDGRSTIQRSFPRTEECMIRLPSRVHTG